jgi:hypothetical protein
MADPRVLGRIVFYALCGAGLAYCSAAPSFQQLPQDAALLRLSMQIAGAQLEPCRPLAPSELARLPPNMRHAERCPRERADVRVRLAVDDAVLVDETLAPKGLARDGAATLYRRIVLPAGSHRVRGEVNDDTRQHAFRYQADARIELAPGQVLTVDFDREAGGVLFR